MKANELMIGDYVYCTNQMCKEGYDKILCIGHSEYDNTELINNISCEYYKPIPLTEEILKANGFIDKTEDLGCGVNEYFYGMFYGDDDTWSISYNINYGCPYLTIERCDDTDTNHTSVVIKDEIYNVHELQHALRLCGLNDLADNFKIERI